VRGLLIADTVISEADFHPGRLAAPEIRDLRVLGLVGIMDPPRPEAREARAACRQAGIAVKMITGDHPDTASAIACDPGLEGGVLTGPSSKSCRRRT
jgi:Ca2+-transporting ATPase